MTVQPEEDRDIWAEIDEMKEELRALLTKRQLLEEHASALKELHAKLEDTTAETSELVHEFYQMLATTPPEVK